MSSSHSTPSKVASAKAGSKSKTSSSSRSSSNKFTPAMQERQARNKDPYSSSDESSDSAWEGQNKRFDTYDSLFFPPSPFPLWFHPEHEELLDHVLGI
jgi:hypothetical protein